MTIHERLQHNTVFISLFDTLFEVKVQRVYLTYTSPPFKKDNIFFKNYIYFTFLKKYFQVKIL